MLDPLLDELLGSLGYCESQSIGQRLTRGESAKKSILLLNERSERIEESAVGSDRRRKPTINSYDKFWRSVLVNCCPFRLIIPPVSYFLRPLIKSSNVDFPGIQS